MGKKMSESSIGAKEVHSQAHTPRNAAQRKHTRDSYSFQTHPLGFTFFPVLCKSPFVFVLIISPKK